MSGRSTRRRSKTARALAAEEQAESEKPAKATATPPQHKSNSKSRARTPNANNGPSADRSLTPSSRSSSRAASPTTSIRSSSRRRSTTQRVSAVAANHKRTSGANTPISRASRSSSVASNSAKKKVPKLKLKTKLGRGYNPGLVNYKDSEYHYGSDFEDDDEHVYEDAAESDKSSDNSDVESHDSDDLKVESDVDLDEIVPMASLPQTPMPFWLREDEDIPSLELPKSSEDLLIPNQYVLRVFSVYEILRRFHQILRLTPFRVEDFCAAVASEEQSNLLSEVHIALLKAIVRAEEANGVTFGPIDQKDSINSLFFFMDSVTWPECLRAFLHSDPAYGEVLEVVKSCEYPFAPIDVVVEKRVEVLNFLADQILSTASVRDFITEDGQQSNEEHCRVCHRLGEMLVCDSCPGVYHLGCLDPPLEDVPEEEWRCYVCQANEVEGVTDCAAGNSNTCRQDCLGIDRAGNKYWFLCRRLVVERMDGTISYYSTVRQLEELSEVLDDEMFEKSLWEAMEEIRLEMEKQMEITEKITGVKKPASKKSYFEIDNANIEKIQKDREQQKELDENDAGNKIQEDLQQMAENDATATEGDDSQEPLETAKGRKDREERLKKREVSRGDGFPDVDSIMDVDKEEEIETMEEVATTTTTPATTITSSSTAETKASTGTNEAPRVNSEALPNDTDLRVTRKTLHEICSGTLYFKLGQEGSYKSYINQFSAKPTALSKQQANEERLKKQHMSHKFSLTDVSTFKWVGSLHGNRSLLVNTLRQTMLQLEGAIPPLFMHPNWQLLRKPWIAAATVSIGSRDFARALTVLQCCMKPCMMLSVWHESLGHTTLKKITNQLKEDRKKVEKRERREKEEEDERLRPFLNHVKYTLGLKHQVSKQKGEEYRAHGQYGWLWLSASRSFCPSDARKLGLRAGPHRVAVKYSDIRDGSHKVVLMEPKAFCYLAAKQEEMDKLKLAAQEKEETKEESDETVVNANHVDGEAAVKEEEPEAIKAEEKSEAKTDEKPDVNKPQDSASRPPVIENKRLEEALKNARLERQAIPDELLSDVVDVCAGLSNPTRVLYSKVAKKAKFLDDFLARRQQLKTLEEKRVELRAAGGIKNNSSLISNIKVARSTEENDVDVEGESESKTAVITAAATAAAAEDSKNKAEVKLDDKTVVTTTVSTCVTTKTTESMTMINGTVDSVNTTTCSTISQVQENSVATANGEIKESNCESKAVVKEVNVTMSDITVKEEEVVKTEVESEAVVNGKTTTKEISETKSDISVKEVKVTDEGDISIKEGMMNSVVKTEEESNSSKEGETANGESTNGSSSSTKEFSETVAQVKEVSGTKAGDVTVKEGVVNATQKVQVEKKDGAVTRVYSSSDTSGKLYLKRIQSVAESKKQSKVVKYPLAPHFYAKTRKKRNILLLAKHDIKHLARKAGNAFAEGFHYGAKVNTQVWPYPCPRATFKTAWLFKTACMDSLQAVALQLRVLWASIKWDDMHMRPISIDGKHQQTSDSAISTTEILKHRHVGRYMDRTQYFQRKVTIPLDVPKTVVEVTPIRSGLRKRKRAESPQQSEPRVVEEWIDEEKLELWEIRAYRERVEREKNASVTRSRTGTSVREPQRLDPSSEMIRRSGGDTASPDLKAKLDEQIRMQREAYLNKTPLNTTPTIIRRVTNPDGTVSLVRTNSRPIAPNSSSPAGTPVNLHPATKKVFISKDGKIIGAQVLPQHQTQGGKIAIPANPQQNLVNASSPAGSPQQKVQIVRSSDGKIQVRGLLPGQQLVQMPDGKLQIFTSGNAAAGAASSPVSVLNSSPTVMNPPGKVALTSPSTAVASPQKILGQQLTPAASTTKQIFAQPLAPGSPIPPGMSVFIAGGKTYAIPKAATLLAQQQRQQAAAAAALKSPSPATNNVTVGQEQQLTATPGKQMVEVKSLGSVTVTFNGPQMIVSGPDVKEAQNIAKLLTSGQARLANLGGKQVLISSTTASTTMTQKSPQTVSAPMLPTQPIPVTQAMSLAASPLPPVTAPVAAAPVQVTAQLLQTAQGPRIVLQGIQGSNLPKEDLGVIQQQVKHQLLKAQAEAKQQGRVPPTKIQIDLPPSIQAKLQPQVKEEAMAAPVTAESKLVSPTQQIVMPPTAAAASKMIVVSQQGQRILGVASPPPQTTTNQQASILLSNLTPTKTGSNEKFEVTPGYIQKAISDALKTQNLTPEIEQKLLAMQQHNTDKHGTGNHEVCKLAPGDEDWEPSRSRKPKIVVDSNSPPKPIADVLASLSPIPLASATVVSKSPQVLLPTTPLPPTATATVVSPPPPNRSRSRSSKSISLDEKKKQQVMAKLQATLFKQKEQLKKDIAKKRALQEKELQIQIHRDMEKIRQIQKGGPAVSSASAEENESEVSAESPTFPAENNKRKRQDSERFESSFSSNQPPSLGGHPSPPKKKKRHSSNSSSAVAAGLIKKDKVYCICKTNYDPSKFYVGCDICNDWFHGSCVGITEAMSRNMTDYICEECQHAKDNQEIYCLCRQPYDESQFYIGCERCSDWFHGRCVGILQSEAETIDEYLCPNCDSNSRLNRANMKSLSVKDHDLVKKLTKQILINRNSWPFKQPVDHNDVPNYYNIVKEPMDLQTVETRVNQHYYDRLCDFVGDVTRIFENCRLFNQPHTQIAKCAETLESFFAQKLVLLREKIASMSS